VTTPATISKAERALELLRASPDGMTARTIADTLEISVDQARHALEYLRKKKLAHVAVNRARHSRWVATLPSDQPPPKPQPEEHDGAPYTLSPSGRTLTPKDEDE
jgi:hypothetical protein